MSKTKEPVVTKEEWDALRKVAELIPLLSSPSLRWLVARVSEVEIPQRQKAGRDGQ